MKKPSSVLLKSRQSLKTPGNSSIAYRAAQSAHEAAKSALEGRKKQSEYIEAQKSVLAKLEAEIELIPATYNPAEKLKIESRLAELTPYHRRSIELAEMPARLISAEKVHLQAQAQLQMAKAEHEQLKAKLTSFGFSDQNAAKEAISAHERLVAALAIAINQLENDQRHHAAAQAALSVAEKRVAEYAERKATLEHHRCEQRHHQTVGKEMDVLLERLNREIGPELEALASDNLSALTDGRYPRLTLDQNFQGTISDGHLPKNVISGGEEDVLALSLRLALAELIQRRNGMPLTLLILDEVFGGLDEDRRMNVMERLTALKGKFEQILVISHIEEINQIADRCLFVRRNPETRASTVNDVPDEERRVPLGGLFSAVVDPIGNSDILNCQTQ
jgi:exonuclease SbcC